MLDSSTDKVSQSGTYSLTSVSKRRKKMDSGELCFFCLQMREIKSEKVQRQQTISTPVLLRCLIHHLQINPNSSEYGGEESESFTTSLSSAEETNEDIEVDLCHSCEKVVNRFSDLALQLEGIYMEMEHYLEGIHACISKSAKNIDRIQNVSQFTFVEKLRKDIADKSLKVRNNIIRKLNVPLSRTARIEKIVTDAVELTPTEVAVKIETESGYDDDHADSEDCEEHSFNSVFDTSSGSDPSSPQLEINLQLKTEEEDAESVPQSKKKRKRKPKPKKSPKKNIKMSYTLYCKRNPITKKFQCNLCETQFKAPQYGRIHYEVAHLKKRYPCDICKDAEFSRANQLKDHQRTCAERLANPTIWKYYRNKAYTVNREGETKTYHCTKCEKISTNVGSILTHFKTVHNPKNIPCDICKVALFTCNSKLKQHQKRCGKPIEKPEKKDFLCDLCGKGFYFKRGLREHHGNAHMERKNVCEVCGKKFISRNDLRRHKKGVHKL